LGRSIEGRESEGQGKYSKTQNEECIWGWGQYTFSFCVLCREVVLALLVGSKFIETIVTWDLESVLKFVERSIILHTR